MRRAPLSAWPGTRPADDAFFARVADALGEAVVVADLDGRVGYLNPAAERLYGVRADDAIGSRASDLPVAPPAAVEDSRRDMRAGRAWTAEVPVTLRDGRTITARVTGAPLRDDAGEVVGLVWLSRLEAGHDLAEAREAVATRERLAALGTLVAGVAHEINNPMTFVRANAELIEIAMAELRRDPARLPRVIGEIETLAREIVKGSDQVEHITRTLRHVARPTGAGPAPLDVAVLARDVAAVAQARETHTVTVGIECATSDLVHANPEAAHQILLNLVLNALAAARDRPDPRVVVRATTVGDAVVIEVEDNGPGIPEEHRASVFVPFFTTHAERVGLGLSLAHRLTTEQKGSLTFTTSPAGTTFRLALPRHRPGRGD